MLEKYLLSVCIPTYNRAPFLKQCLESIAPQIIKAGLKNIVEIVIADNASTDETEKIVAEYITAYPGLINYFKNETNLGFDRSFVRLMEQSQSTYCLCLGDDDALFEDSLTYVVNSLEKHTDVGLAWVNNWGYDRNLHNPVLLQPNLPPAPDKRYNELSEYIYSYREYENLVGFFVGLSNQLIRRKDWVAFVGKEKYMGTQAIHMYINLQVFKNSPFLLITRPIVRTRASNIRWGVFSGLETIHGRIRSTMEIATWIRNTYSLPIAITKLRFRIMCNAYWATFKENIKILFNRYGLNFLVTWYRNLRKGTLKNRHEI
ncbi:MAG TPA: glycosyltransferase family 2 protein [Candidatus Paceibacterota bacterium]|nr:glycosyltransferase family 2 protein [Candidatus Paceibacterota bacterium]HMO82762.1 glycosyltransferase family 2 protein [Candidatus Paceibacterota bacterium]